MTAAVHTIVFETIQQFVARHRSGVFTSDVARRFNMTNKEARRELKRLEALGMIKSKREAAGGDGAFAGAGLLWTTD